MTAKISDTIRSRYTGGAAKTDGIAPAPQASFEPARGGAQVARVTTAYDGRVADPVPTSWDIQQLAAGQGNPQIVAAALKQALLTTNPAAVKKAVETLQIAESFQNQHRVQSAAFEGTGYDVQRWPGLTVQLSAPEAYQVAQTLGGPAHEVLAMLHREGLLEVEVPGGHGPFGEFQARPEAYLSGSRGTPAPRGDAKTMKESWNNNLIAGQTIRDAVKEVAEFNATKAGGAGQVKMTCPFAHGNHAKGASFGNARFQADPAAPAWVKDLLSQPGPGRVRISSSATDPNEPDQQPHQTGIRIAIPFGGSLDDPTTTRMDLTLNTGPETHAESGRDHTEFTKRFTVPRDGLVGSKPVRIAKHLLDGQGDGLAGKLSEVKERIDEVRVALGATRQAKKETFNEHVFWGRHAFFAGGRHVQVRIEVVEPTSFADIRRSKDPNADLNEIKRTIASGGLKLRMYVAEIPPGRPELVEQENWKDVSWWPAGTIELPPQDSDPASPHSAWFHKTPHVPVGANKLFQAEGIGRDRVYVYAASGQMRTGWRDGDGLDTPKWDGSRGMGW
ncbi:MAG: hypothetical protein JNK82_20065 [Myxococcaceae bacterium]|nr:hypothetical protein [Myxococcaceae bacterium]